jgi:hypothetical protein
VSQAARFRGTISIPLAQVAERLGELRDSTYVSYRKGLAEAGASLPERFSDTVAAVVGFADPMLDGIDADPVEPRGTGLDRGRVRERIAQTA